jgi:hypothetical protein
VNKRVSALTGRIQQLKITPPKANNNKDKEDDDDGFQKLEEDVVYDLMVCLTTLDQCEPSA